MTAHARRRGGRGHAELLAGPGAPADRGICTARPAPGWLFVTPMIVFLGLFLVLPILMALWVSVSDWTGRGSPFTCDVGFVGMDNYRRCSPSRA